jgi:dinuclear metal center YbgI/SA1388 family protein
VFIKEIIATIEEFAPLHLQAGFDNSGLACGDVDRELTAVLLTLDVTGAVVEEAIREGANLVVSHHPLLFHPLRRLAPDTDAGRAIILAIKHDIALYSAHTNMDVVARGVSDRAADRLHLTSREILQPEGNSNPQRGYGIIGNLETPEEAIAFLRRVKERFDCPVIRHTNPPPRAVRRVAICGGSGASFIPAALERGADVYLSADFKYHDFFLAADRLVLADIGHRESEQFTKDIFHEILLEKIPNFAIRFSRIKTDPINYL